jgi:hypothetical protein
MARPQTLAEVALIVRRRAGDYAMALDEFCDEFYLDHPDKAAQQRRLVPVPDAVGHPLADAWIGAWTQRAVHFALEEPHFLPASKALRGVVIVESPPAFRSRLIFTRAEPLARARFPKGVPRAAVALQWPPPKETDEPADPARSTTG